MERVSWSVSPTRSPSLRRATYAVLGLFGGLVVLVGAITLGLGLGRLADGDPRLLALLVVLASIGGALAALYLLPMLRDPEQRPPALAIRFERLDREWLAISSLAGAAALWFLARASPLAALAAVAVGAVGFVALLGAAHNEGTVDPEARTLVHRDREVDLAAVAGMDGYEVGPATLLRLSYERGAAGPRFFLLPTRAARVAREVVDTDDRVGAGAERASDPRPGR